MPLSLLFRTGRAGGGGPTRIRARRPKKTDKTRKIVEVGKQPLIREMNRSLGR